MFVLGGIKAMFIVKEISIQIRSTVVYIMSKVLTGLSRVLFDLHYYLSSVIELCVL